MITLFFLILRNLDVDVRRRSFELLRNIQVEKLCVLIQKHHRRTHLPTHTHEVAGPKGIADAGYMAQKLLKRIKLVKAPLDEALKSRDIDKLKAALEKAKDIEFKIKLIADCEKLLNFLVKEKELNRKVCNKSDTRNTTQHDTTHN